MTHDASSHHTPDDGGAHASSEINETDATEPTDTVSTATGGTDGADDGMNTATHRLWDRTLNQLRKHRIPRLPRDGRRGIPLRIGLVLVTILVSSVGLLASAVGIQQAMYEVTFSRVDDDLEDGVRTWARRDELFDLSTYPSFVLPTDYFVYRYYRDGTYSVVRPDGVAPPNIRQVKVGDGPHFVDSLDPDNPENTDIKWRVVAGTYDDSIIVVGKRIDDELSLLRNLAVGQFIIGLLVVILIGVSSYFIIRHTLRPLRAMEETAKAISMGELDRRVPTVPENTEVGALSRSVNVMLERLQLLILELQAKESEMRRFLGDASHELRTPLTSVKGYAELYRSGATDDATMVVDKIEEEAKRMSLLVEDLLSLTRSEEARFDRSSVDVLALSVSVVTSLGAAYPDRTIEVDNHSAEIPVVLGDAGRLHQVLTNLVVNALNHGGDHAKVTVLIDATDTDVIVDVKDDGVGMKQEDAHHIFERFYRADTSRTRSTGGSGLGLAIVKSIVEAHNGTVSVTTEENVGTTFTVVLPKNSEVTAAAS